MAAALKCFCSFLERRGVPRLEQRGSADRRLPPSLHQRLRRRRRQRHGGLPHLRPNDDMAEPADVIPAEPESLALAAGILLVEQLPQLRGERGRVVVRGPLVGGEAPVIAREDHRLDTQQLRKRLAATAGQATLPEGADRRD
jgi:hypothetical protein